MKLSKEQAEWLIEEINSRVRRKAIPGAGALHDVFLFPIDVENIINQCTEKEFPAFEMNLYTQDQVELDEKPDVLKVNQYGDYTSPIHVEYRDVCGEALDFLIPTEKFKQFADGVNKIVEYLNEVE